MEGATPPLLPSMSASTPAPLYQVTIRARCSLFFKGFVLVLKEKRKKLKSFQIFCLKALCNLSPETNVSDYCMSEFEGRGELPAVVCGLTGKTLTFGGIRLGHLNQ